MNTPISRWMLAIVLVTFVGCGKKKTDPPPKQGAAAEVAEVDEAAPKADEQVPAGADLAPKGSDIDRMCDFYASAKTDQAEMMEEKVEGDPLADCKESFSKHSATDRQRIADCANACGDTDGVVDCFEQFGTPTFPACTPESDDYGDDDDDDDAE